MTEFNYFGATVSDIVQYYHGTETNDFATAGISGDAVITNELEYAEAKVLEALPVNLSNVLENGIPYVYVYDQQNIGIQGVSFTGLVKRPIVTSINGSNILGISCSTGQCPNDLSSLWDATTETITVNAGVVSISGADANYDYYAQMNFGSTLVLGSLKRLVRDLVACRLGSQLFSRGGEDEWKSVTRACEESQATLEMIQNDPNWMPYELRKLKYLPGTSPVKIKSGISTLRVARG